MGSRDTASKPPIQTAAELCAEMGVTPLSETREGQAILGAARRTQRPEAPTVLDPTEVQFVGFYVALGALLRLLCESGAVDALAADQALLDVEDTITGTRDLSDDVCKLMLIAPAYLRAFASVRLGLDLANTDDGAAFQMPILEVESYIREAIARRHAARKRA
jgi:hypothetical protein